MTACVVFVTTTLDTGGAETMLLQLLSRFDPLSYRVAVISLRTGGTIGPRIEKLGVEVVPLNLGRNPIGLVRAYRRLGDTIRRLKPDVLHGWMYHGNLVALLSAARWAQRAKVVWTIHQTVYTLDREKLLTRFLIRLGARVSRRADAITYVSTLSREQHERLGYVAASSSIVPNGFDLQQLAPGRDAGAQMRGLLGLRPDAIVVGHIARFHPMKDHRNLLLAASRVLRARPDVAFVLAGQGVDERNAELTRVIEELDIGGSIHLLGERDDVPELLSTFDIFCISSAWGEAFPMVVGEAMAAGVPCVVTRVGDAPAMVGEFGGVAAPNDPDALAAELLRWIETPAEDRRRAGMLARERVHANFEIGAITRRYQAIYTGMREQTSDGWKAG